MGTGRTFNKQSRTRPVKKPRERKRRDAVQRKRLMGLGMESDIVTHMTSRDIRAMLRRPAKLQVKE